MVDYKDKYFLMRQENLYWNSELKDYKWYRKLFGGQWRYIKLGKDTPYVALFAVWTKMGDECWEGYKEIIETENYPETGADTKLKLFKEFFKQKFKSIKWKSVSA